MMRPLDVAAKQQSHRGKEEFQWEKCAENDELRWASATCEHSKFDDGREATTERQTEKCASLLRM